MGEARHGTAGNASSPSGGMERAAARPSPIPPPCGEVGARGLVRDAPGGGTETTAPVRPGDVAAAAARRFREARIASPELDARLLLCHATGLSHEDYVAHLNDMLSPEAAVRFGAFIERRLSGEPVSRIVGMREFYGRPFRIDRSTLDPRPDTETLIEAALALVDRRTPLKLLDLGTGSGCILVTLLAELPHATGVGIDKSLAALEVARANALDLGVADRAGFVAGDWLDGVDGAFDLIVANPPYLTTAEMAGLAREVADHDPAGALDGGPDGLAAYRRIVPRLRDVLRPGGIALFEVGHTQAEAVSRLLAEAGLAPEKRPWPDLAGRPRVVGGRRPG